MSTKVTSGRLKASQKATKRAPLREAVMSSVPARAWGWLATIPTARPPTAAKAVTRLGPQSAWGSSSSPSSTTADTTSRTS